MIQCLTIPFEESLDPYDLSNGPKMCVEINMSKIFYKSSFKDKEVFHFTFFFKTITIYLFYLMMTLHYFLKLEKFLMIQNLKIIILMNTVFIFIFFIFYI